MRVLSDAETGSLVVVLANAIEGARDELGRIDGAIGDGDHGINMAKGFSLARKSYEQEPTGLQESMSNLGRILMTKIGGSMGPLYGCFFMAFGKGLEPEIDRQVFFDALCAATTKLQQISQAEEGDKTLLDCLMPALNAYSESFDHDGDFTRCLEAMARGARRGRDATVDMAARVGRASRLGERSRGVPDAGATSCCIILSEMANFFIKANQ